MVLMQRSSMVPADGSSRAPVSRQRLPRRAVDGGAWRCARYSCASRGHGPRSCLARVDRCTPAGPSTTWRTTRRPRAGVGPRARPRPRPARANSASTASASPPSDGQHALHPAVIGEGEQGLLGHRVDGVRSRQRLDVERVRRLGILGAGAGPEQALRPRAGGRERAPARRRQQLAVGPVGALRDGDARGDCEAPAAPCPATATSQRLTKSEATEPIRGIEPGRDAPFDAPHVRFGRRDVLLAENSSVTLTGTPAKIDSSIAGTPSGVPGILMNRLGRCALARAARAAASMVPAVSLASSGETSSDTQPSTPPVRRGRAEEIGGARQVLERQLEEQRLARLAPPPPSGGWRRRRQSPSADRVIEDRGVGGQPGHRQLADVAAQRAVVSSPRVMLSSQRLWPRSCSCVWLSCGSPSRQLGPARRSRRSEHRGCASRRRRR